MLFHRFRSRPCRFVLVALLGLAIGTDAAEACERMWRACLASCCDDPGFVPDPLATDQGEESGEPPCRSSEELDEEGQAKPASARIRVASQRHRPPIRAVQPVSFLGYPRAVDLQCAQARRIPVPHATASTPIYIQIQRFLN